MIKRSEMLRKVQMLSFVLTEVNLFLDTHKGDTAALRFYDKYNTLYKEAVSEYEDAYGPLSPCGINIKNGEDWVTGPWPWEVEG